MDETPWKQVNIAYPGDNADQERHAASHLNTILPTAEDDGLITQWWFLRKGPWRVRYLPANPDSDPVHALLTDGISWTRDIYEPEIHAFGGHASMDLAHQLFHHDSRYLLPFLRTGAPDRREHALLRCTTFMRAAGLDIHEQGDVWAQVAEHRSRITTPPIDADVWQNFTRDISHLLRGRPRTDTPGHDWLTAFADAGQGLRTLREKGALTRGIRAITALHVIFHWNRVGLDVTTQALLARAAKDAIFGSTTADEHTRPR